VAALIDVHTKLLYPISWLGIHDSVKSVCKLNFEYSCVWNGGLGSCGNVVPEIRSSEDWKRRWPHLRRHSIRCDELVANLHIVTIFVLFYFVWEGFGNYQSCMRTQVGDGMLFAV